MSAADEVRGVRLGDVYRDRDGDLWEVISLCTEPTVTVQRADRSNRETHVIGCLNWQTRWREGPLRLTPERPK